MKRIFFLIAASLISVALSAQTWGFTQFEMKVNDGNHDLIVEAFEEQVKNNAIDSTKLDGSSNYSFSSQIRYTGSDTNTQALATRGYVDSVAAGLDPKDSCKVATTANITLSGTQTIDGVSVSAGDRVLVKSQSSSSANGIYICDAGSWSRSSDMATGSAAAGQCSATISRNGDLVHRMYLEVLINSTTSVSEPMAGSITDVELEIGGQKIDKQTGLWMHVWSCLTEPNPSGYTGISTAEAGTGTNFQNMSGMGGLSGDGTKQQSFNVPLQFWFCRNPGLALPLIALQYHEVKVILNHDFSHTSTNAPTTNKLWCDYIYLDTDERRRFAQVSHEYLIEQVQEATVTAAGTSDLNFNHPVKELIFCRGTVELVSNTIGSAELGTSSTSTYQLKLNGHDRFSARDYRYFTRTQIWQHHSGAGGLHCAEGDGKCNDSIGVYSFALKPEEHQPSGTCNFSRIDNAQLVQGSTSTADKVFAVNYNVLRIMSGMGGLAYSN